jgi:uncharacterized protein (DUF1810 family)
MKGEFPDMNGQAILENVRRYRATASLYRQTAAFRPCQSRSLLEQARDWESRALAELDAYFAGGDQRRRIPSSDLWSELVAA